MFRSISAIIAAPYNTVTPVFMVICLYMPYSFAADSRAAYRNDAKTKQAVWNKTVINFRFLL